MSDFFVTANGAPVRRLELHEPGQGVWFADVDLFDDAVLTGAVALVVGSVTLRGTVDPSASGSHMKGRYARIIGGAGGWGTLVVAASYHNDAGVRARTVVDDVAKLAGETIGTFAPASEKLGHDYARSIGPASRVLEDAIGGAAWWVGRDGITNVGARPTAAADPNAVHVLEFDPRHRDAKLKVQDIGAVAVGYTLTSPQLDETLTIRALETVITPDEGITVTAWCPNDGSTTTQIADSLRTIAYRFADSKLWGKYRYRVVNMTVDRVNLQAVSKAPGLPDRLPLVSMWPGVSGAHAKVSPGCQVLVEFIAGDREDPIITGFIGKDGSAWVPEVTHLGGTNGSEVVRKGDPVECPLPPAIFSGTIGGAPASGVLTFPVMKLVGANTGGTPKVKAGQ